MGLGFSACEGWKWLTDASIGSIVPNKGVTLTNANFMDAPPESAVLTDYDQAHVKLYMRLLDAHANNADWREVVSVLFAFDPTNDPERARHIHDSHLARAKWMTEHGYRQLLSGDTP